jgi:hypothetical protein
MNVHYLLRTLPALAALACGLPHAAHALTDTEALSMVYEHPAPSSSGRPASQGAPAQYPRGCRIHVRKVEDLRRNTETVGGPIFMMPGPAGVPVNGASLLSGDGLKWTTGALPSLKASGVQTEATAAAAGERSVEVALRLAQAWTSGLNMHSYVMLQATVPTRDGEVLKRYHGFGTKLNFANGNAEYMATLNLGMADALKAYAADLRSACEGKLVAASS